MKGEDNSIGRWISILYRYGQSYVSKKLEEFNIGSGQHVILLTLSRKDGISQEELADYLKIDKGSIAKSIKKLEDDDYIIRRVDKEDKRAYKVFLTRKAKDIMPVLQKTINQWEEDLIFDLTDEEKNLIADVLHTMAVKAYNIKVNDEENDK